MATVTGYTKAGADAALAAAVAAAASDATSKASAAQAAAVSAASSLPYRPSVLVKTSAAQAVPSDFPAGGLVLVQAPLRLREWNGLGIPGPSRVSTSVIGRGDSRFSLVNGTLTFQDGELILPSSTSAKNVVWDTLGGAAKAISWYQRVSAAPASGAYGALFSAQATTGGANLLQVQIDSAMKPRLRNNASTSLWTGPTLSVDVAYRFDLVLLGAGMVRLSVSDAGTALLGTTTQDCGFGSTVPDTFTFGQNTTVAFGPLKLSNLAVTDTATEVGPSPARAVYDLI